MRKIVDFLKNAFRRQKIAANYSISCECPGDGLWHHIVVVRRHGKIVQYIDGMELGSSAVLGAMPLFALAFWIRSDVVSFNRAIAATEVKTLYTD